MSFRLDQCKLDAHMMAETCRIFADTLEPEERADFYSALLRDLADDCEMASHVHALAKYESRMEPIPVVTYGMTPNV